MKKTEEEQEVAMDMIDDILANVIEKREEGFSLKELSPMLREVFIIFREYCPYDDIIDHINEVEKAFEDHLKRRVH